MRHNNNVKMVDIQHYLKPYKYHILSVSFPVFKPGRILCMVFYGGKVSLALTSCCICLSHNIRICCDVTSVSRVSLWHATIREVWSKC